MYLGIDGGGTKTKVMLMDKDNTIIADALSGPSSIRTVSLETSIANITKGIVGCLAQYPHAKIKGVFAGIGDVVSDNDAAKITHRLKTIPALTAASITVKNDVYNAHAAALSTPSGIIIIIGTGSVAFGIDEAGNTHRAGGYSYKEGDQGSAYALGKDALSILGKALDGRVAKTPFTHALMHTLNIFTFKDAVAIYEEFHTQRTRVAALAKLVTAYAHKHDPLAYAIIEKASDELFLMIKAVDTHLTLTNKDIGIIGSLGNADTPLRTTFIKKVLSYNPNFTIHESHHDPAYGACLLAKRRIDN